MTIGSETPPTSYEKLMGEVALENRMKLHFFSFNLRFHLEAHEKRLVKSFLQIGQVNVCLYNAIASFDCLTDKR